MNVLFITTCTTLLGANRAMLTQIQHLKSKGVVPIVLLPFDGEITLKLKEQNVEYCVHKFKTFKSPHSGVPSYIRFMAVLLYNFLYALPLLYVVFRKRNISIIHTNTSVCDIGAFLASMLHCRHIWHLREFGCEDYGLTCPIKKYEYYVYNRGFSEFIAISGAIYTYYSVFIKRPIYLVYDGVTIPDSKFLANHENSEIHFCCAGVLTVQKNQLQIVEAANILLNKYLVNNFTVTIIGADNNAYSEYLKCKIREYGLNDHFQFTGFIMDMDSIYKTMDIGIMPSLSEAFGLVTIEYMLHNLLVIASNRGANLELIEHSKTGLLYDIDCTDSLAELMLWCVQNKQAVLQIAEQGRVMATNCYTSKANADKVFEIYAENKI